MAYEEITCHLGGFVRLELSENKGFVSFPPSLFQGRCPSR